MYKSLSTKILACSLMLVSGLVSAEGELYRYTGENGEVVIDDHIPPEFVPNGYSVLSKSGFEIEKVKPALTEAELANLSEEQRLEEEQKIQAQQDKWLLDRYSEASDAELARDRQLGSLETLVVVAESNIKKLKEEEKKELTYAASSERAGREVPQDVLDSLERIRSQIRAAEQQIEKQKFEQKKLAQQFQGYIDRLKEIDAAKNGE